MSEQSSFENLQKLKLKQRSNHHQRKCVRANRSLTIATVVVAVVAAVAGGVQAFYAGSAFSDTQNAERAWIRAEVSPANLTWKQEMIPGAEPIGSASMATSLFVTNEGKLPAFSVHGFITGLAVHRASGFLVNDKEDCDRKASTLDSEKGPHIGQIVFPGQHSKVVDTGTDPADIDFVRIPNHLFDWRKDSFLLNTVIRADIHGCVIYKLSPSGKYHHTMFNFNLERTDTNSEEEFLFKVGSTVLEKDIKLLQIETDADAN